MYLLTDYAKNFDCKRCFYLYSRVDKLSYLKNGTKLGYTLVKNRTIVKNQLKQSHTWSPVVNFRYPLEDNFFQQRKSPISF